MRIQRVLVALTVLNFGLLAYLLEQTQTVRADSAAAVLRGRSLEIVDEQGRVRASIKVQNVDPKYKMPNGQPYPETVMFRLIDEDGRPEVKIGASRQGGGVGLIGATDAVQARLKAEGELSAVELAVSEKRQRRIEP